MKSHRIRGTWFAGWFVSLPVVALAVSPFDVAQYKGRASPASVGERFRFVIASDRTGGHVPGLTEQGFKEINQLRPEFILSVGDLIEGYVPVGKRYGNRMVKTEAEKLTILDEQWDEFDGLVGLLDAPFIYVPGNHDISDLVAHALYRKRYGPTYLSFDYKGVHFVCLNSEEAELINGEQRIAHEITGEQLAWLKKDIDANRDAKLILLFFHQPLWLYQDGRAFRKAEEVLAGTNYVVIAAHTHTYSYDIRNGRPYITVGPIGGVQQSPEIVPVGRFRHYTLVTVEDSQAHFALIKLGGVVSAMSVWREDQQAIRQLYASGRLQRLEADPGTQQIQLHVRNPLDRPVKIGAIWGKDVGPWHITPAKLETVSLEPKASRTFTFTARPLLPTAVFHDPLAHLTYRFTGQSGQEVTAPHAVPAMLQRRLAVRAASRPIQVDGDLSDWPEGLPQARLSHGTQIMDGLLAWQGPNDLSASFRAAADDEALYLAVVLTDEHIACRSGDELWQGDSVEVLYSSGPPDLAVNRRDKRFHQIIVAPAGEKRQPRMMCNTAGKIPQGFTAAYRQRDGGYQIELAIPLSDLPPSEDAPRTVAFDLAVNDRDAADRRDSQIVWSSKQRHSDQSNQFGRLIFEAR